MIDVDETTEMSSDWNISVWWQIDESVMMGASESRMVSRVNLLTIAASCVVTSKTRTTHTVSSSFWTITKSPGFVLNPTLGKYKPVCASFP
jgi:hypothetical protein